MRWDTVARRFLHSSNSGVSTGNQTVRAQFGINLHECALSVKHSQVQINSKLKEKNCMITYYPRLVDNYFVYVYQFLTSNSDFKTTSNLPNFIFPSILLIKNCDKYFVKAY